MDFMILDSAGNAVESFDSEKEAVRALLEMAEADSRAATHVAVLAFDAEGHPVGDPLTVADVRLEAATSLVMSGGDAWTQRGTLTVLSRRWAGSVAPWRVAGAR